MDGPDGRVVAADWVLPVTRGPIRHGAVAIRGDRVEWVGRLAGLPRRLAALPVQHRSGVLTPGLVNAHSHLQFTHFAKLGKGSYASFEHWCEDFALFYDAVRDPRDWRAAADDGARQLIRSGTTVVADVVTNDEARSAIARAGITGIEYLEVIGQHERSWRGGGRSELLARLAEPASVPCGLSPHAPYSLDAPVVRDLADIALERGLRVHSHVAESSAEAELYATGRGPVLDIFGDLRDEFALVRSGGSGLDTASFVDSEGLLRPNTHLAHAVYLDRKARDLLRQRGTRVALCPRSNAVLGLDAPPVAAYLSEGHEISVGTDSLASSPSLDLLADVARLAEIARRQGYTGDDLPVRLLRAATLGGADALGLHDTAGYGTLTPGGPADLAVFDVPLDVDTRPEALVVEHGAGRCTLTVAAGRFLHDSSGRPQRP